MLFNSIDFAVFLPIVFFIYWFVINKNLKLQNFFLVVVSYVFYGWWDWRFLSLILFSTILDFFIGNQLDKTTNKHRRKILLLISIIVNLGFLGYFKYYNFFIENFVKSFSFFGHDITYDSLKIILPVGISFYTFQTLSYTIDIFKKQMKPAKNFIEFAAFVSFFPQLVAGPIERAKNLLPQFYIKREFNYSNAVDGLRQILWGLFKKVVIADNSAKYANLLFNNSDDYSGLTLLLGAFFFSLQIYGDFSGYSDIAIGTSRLFGFNLSKNFSFPYFSRDIAEFWRRWHISLSTWFRDYLYIPLGGSKGNLFSKIRNVFIIFIVSGFWHGANWTFIAWGFLNALYFIPLMLLNKNRKNLNIISNNNYSTSIKNLLNIGITFFLTMIAWVFFRAESISHAFKYLQSMFIGLSQKTSYIDAYNLLYWDIGFSLPILIVLFIIIEWIGKKDEYAIEKIFKNKKLFQWLFYYLIITLIVLFGSKEQQFIYFQF